MSSLSGDFFVRAILHPPSSAPAADRKTFKLEYGYFS